MWRELYNKVKAAFLAKEDESFLISVIENSRDMQRSYHGPREWIPMMDFLEKKSAEEEAVAAGKQGAPGAYIGVIGGSYE